MIETITFSKLIFIKKKYKETQNKKIFLFKRGVSIKDGGKKLKKLLVTVLVLSLLAATFVGCGGNDSGDTPAEGTQRDKIVYALWNSPSGVFQPLIVDDEYNKAVIEFVFETLLDYDDEMNLVPKLAKSYEVSEDGLVLTFHLNEGIKWHDGEPFTANDVAFTFNALAQKDYTGPRYSDVERLVGAKECHEGKTDKVEGIKVIDEYTISFEFEECYPPGLAKIGADRAIIPEHLWKDVPVGDWANATELMNAPVGCGAYKLTKFEPGQYVELTANEEYFEGTPATKNVIFKVSNQETVVAELVNGEIDIADISSLKAQDLATLEENGIKIADYPGITVQYMGMNLREPIFQDKNVRQAITYAIDRKVMVDKLLEGHGTLINAPMLPTLWAYPKDDSLNEYNLDIDKAKDLLAESGWEDRNNDGIVEDESGKPFSVTLSYPIGNKIREMSAPIIQANLKEIGIDVKLETMEFAALLDKVMANHEFDMYLMGSSLDTDPDPKPIWHSDAASDEKGNSAWNIVGFRYPEADKYMMDALATTDMQTRAELYKKFAILVNEEAPQVFLYCPDIMKAYNPKLQNYEPSTFHDYNDFTKWVIVD